MAGKIDLKKQHKQLFAPKREPHLVEVRKFQYLMIDGEGAPERTAFQDAIAALYSTAYTTKFALKKAGREDFVVPPLEALWWADDESAFEGNRRDEWQWTLMVILPDHVSDEDLRGTLAELEKKGKLTDVHGECEPRCWRKANPCSACMSGHTTRWEAQSRRCGRSRNRRDWSLQASITMCTCRIRGVPHRRS